MGRPRIVRRWPLDPLFAAMGLTPNQACTVLGLSGSTQQLYRRDGVSDDVADRLAVRAGLHPYEVWPELADAHTAEIHAADRARAERRREANRSWYRARYENDPEFRAAELERARRTYLETRRYRIRQSAIYQDRQRAVDPDGFRAKRREQEAARRARKLAEDPVAFRAAQAARQRAYRARKRQEADG